MGGCCVGRATRSGAALSNSLALSSHHASVVQLLCCATPEFGLHILCPASVPATPTPPSSLLSLFSLSLFALPPGPLLLRDLAPRQSWDLSRAQRRYVAKK